MLTQLVGSRLRGLCYGLCGGTFVCVYIAALMSNMGFFASVQDSLKYTAVFTA